MKANITWMMGLAGMLSIAACSSLPLPTSDDASSSKEEKSEKGTGTDNTCQEGAKKSVDCNTCSCEAGGVWSCTELGCEADDPPSDPGPISSCDALGVTWRFQAGACILEEWAGCGPSGTHFDSQKECLAANGLTPALQMLATADCPKFPIPKEGMDNGECPAGVVAGGSCTGNGGPGCSGADCQSQEEMVCVSGGTELACRPVDFVCN